MTHIKQNVGPDIVVDHYDGPITTLRVVAFERGDQQVPDRLLEVETMGWVTGSYPRHAVHCRLSREQLLTALAMLDGKPVEDFYGETRLAIPDGFDAADLPTIAP